MSRLLTLKKHLAQPKTSWQLCLLAAIGGFASALLVILFILTIQGLSYLYLEHIAEYINSDSFSRLLIPIFGVCLILLLGKITGYQYLRTGIPFVLNRLKVAYGVIPFRNTFNQFFGSASAIASGFSVGREGPAVHLGAACSSYLGNKLGLPYNAIRTLCACGIAAGISASFNTPIAAVIFVMEVILREYKVYIFIPIMIAALIGSMMTQAVFGPAHDYEFFNTISLDLEHFPLLIILGVMLGILSSSFNLSLTKLVGFSQLYSLPKRLLVAALITGLFGFFLPEAVSLEFKFDQQNSLGMSPVIFILCLLVAKLIMTTTALGLGVPGGVVGPILFIGALAGVATAHLIALYVPGQQFTTDYALMGMAGFMAATLNAPLAALLAVVELSNQIEIILPAMLVISTACVASGQFLKNRSVFIMQLEVQKLLYRQPPIEKSLQRIGVLGVMQENIKLVHTTKFDTLKPIYEEHGDNLVIVSKMADKQASFIWHAPIFDGQDNLAHFEKYVLLPMSSRATLSEAYNALIDARQGGIYVYENTPDNILGIVTFSQLRKYLLEGKTHS